MIAAALIAAFACPAQPVVVEDVRGSAVHTRAVACAGDRRVVLRRARLRRPRGRPSSGRLITEVAAAGPYVAWAEIRLTRGRVTGVVGVSRIARGRARPVERRVVFRGAGSRWLDVVVTTRGELVWAGGGRLVTALIGERQTRTLAEDVEPWVALEEDRTVRWQHARKPPSYTPRLDYTDLRPWPQPGCPPRARFRRSAESDQVLVTTASYGRGDDRLTAMRACLRATGADPAIATAEDHERLAAVAFAGEWVVLTRTVSGPRGCAWVGIEVYAAGSGLAGRPGMRHGCRSPQEPDRAEPLVVTTSGVPAWIVTEAERSILLTTSGGGLIGLDEAAPGGLTALAADGTRVRWLHDGQLRSMDLG